MSHQLALVYKTVSFNVFFFLLASVCECVLCIFNCHCRNETHDTPKKERNATLKKKLSDMAYEMRKMSIKKKKKRRYIKIEKKWKRKS